jgi:hypothetical protein
MERKKVSSACLLFVFTMVAIGSGIIFPNSTMGAEVNNPVIKGSLTFGNTTVNYNDGVAVSGIFDGVSKTIVYLTDKMGDKNEAVRALLKNGTHGGPGNRLELSFDPKGNLKYYFFYLKDGGTDQNIGKAPESIKSETTISKSRVKGRVMTQKPLEIFDKKYKFDVTFDLDNVSK